MKVGGDIPSVEIKQVKSGRLSEDGIASRR